MTELDNHAQLTPTPEGQPTRWHLVEVEIGSEAEQSLMMWTNSAQMGLFGKGLRTLTSVRAQGKTEALVRFAQLGSCLKDLLTRLVLMAQEPRQS